MVKIHKMSTENYIAEKDDDHKYIAVKESTGGAGIWVDMSDIDELIELLQRAKQEFK